MAKRILIANTHCLKNRTNGSIAFPVVENLRQVCKDYFDRMYTCESQKYDMEYEVRKREFEVTSIAKACIDFRKPVDGLGIQKCK